jgi:hypothetical protein
MSAILYQVKDHIMHRRGMFAGEREARAYAFREKLKDIIIIKK